MAEDKIQDAKTNSTLAAADKEAAALAALAAKKSQDEMDTAKAPRTAIVKDAKKVEIRILKNHTCSIGGVEYDFEKDSVISVGEDVCAILQNGGIAFKK